MRKCLLVVLKKVENKIMIFYAIATKRDESVARKYWNIIFHRSDPLTHPVSAKVEFFLKINEFLIRHQRGKNDTVYANARL